MEYATSLSPMHLSWTYTNSCVTGFFLRGNGSANSDNISIMDTDERTAMDGHQYQSWCFQAVTHVACIRNHRPVIASCSCSNSGSGSGHFASADCRTRGPTGSISWIARGRASERASERASGVHSLVSLRELVASASRSDCSSHLHQPTQC